MRTKCSVSFSDRTAFKTSNPSGSHPIPPQERRTSARVAAILTVFISNGYRGAGKAVSKKRRAVAADGLGGRLLGVGLLEELGELAQLLRVALGGGEPGMLPSGPLAVDPLAHAGVQVGVRPVDRPAA